MQGATALPNDLLLQRVRMASDCNNVVRSFKEEAIGSYGHVIRDISKRGRNNFFLSSSSMSAGVPT